MRSLREKKKKLKKAIDCGFQPRMPNYTFTSVLFRSIFHGIVSYLMIQLFVYISDEKPTEPLGLFPYIKVFLYFTVLSESQILFDLILEKILPIPEKIRLRLFIQSLIGIMLIVVLFNVSNLEGEKELTSKTEIYLSFAIGLLFVSMFSSAILLMRMTDKWIFHQKELDKMKQDQLRSDYNHLQDQLNPHFLFNNLSALKSLIIYDKEKAINFTENFTDIYRYVLQCRDKMVVKLSDEMGFLKSYGELHEIRLGDGIIGDFNVPKEFFHKELAPLSLQTLIENAIKHNITSKDKPLKISIYEENNYIVVSNNLQPKITSYSTHSGLDNLKKRYQMLTEREVEIIETEQNFTVKIPLL